LSGGLKTWVTVSLASILASQVATAAQSPYTSGGEVPAWSVSLAAGYDTYIQTYPLATEDTTETVSEMTAVIGLEGRSASGAVHRWLVRPELSVGTELIRGRLDFDYRWRPDGRSTLLRLEGSGGSRHYRGSTDYFLASDAIEGRASARCYLGPTGRWAGELRLFGRGLRYSKPSTLEINYRQAGGMARLRTGPQANHRFSLGGRWFRQEYPDSSAIDRSVAALEADFENAGGGRDLLRFYHRSERRLIRDQTARPSAWSHWSDWEGRLPAGKLTLGLELHSEVWQYDQESSAYFNSWRLRGAFSVRGGGLLSPGWQVGLVAERLDAGDSPETFTQHGVLVGFEQIRPSWSGSVNLTYGRREYTLADSEESLPADAIFPADSLTYYSDFNFWELWLMIVWSVGNSFSWEILANYQPESHTEKMDDTAVAFASVRLVWRP
jgi:hypothetical protein